MVMIRPARSSELPALVTASLDSFVEQHASLGQEALELARDRAPQLRARYAPNNRLHDGDAFFVAVDGQQTVAQVWLCQHATVLRSGFVLDIAVAPDQRRTGLGRALMRVAETWAREQGLPRLSLHVLADNAPARSLYAREGYREVNRVATGPSRTGVWAPANASAVDYARGQMVGDLVATRVEVGDVAADELDAVAAGTVSYLLREGVLHPDGILLDADGGLGYVMPAGSAGVVAWVAADADLRRIVASAQAYAAHRGWPVVQVSYHAHDEEAALVEAGFTPTDVNLVKDLRVE